MIPIIVAGGAVASNYKTSKSLSYSSIGSINVMRYYTYMFLKSEESEMSADSFLSDCESYRDSTEYAGKIENYYIRKSLFKIAEKPFKFIGFNMKGWVNYFLDFGRYDLNQIFGNGNRESEGLLNVFAKKGYGGIMEYFKRQNVFQVLYFLLLISFNALSLLSFLYFIFIGTDDVRVRIILGISVFAIMAATGPIGASRFRHPVFPLMLYALNYNLHFISSKIKSSDNRNLQNKIV
ncbi:MAG: hypothetical protein AB7T10_08330 [bacterium]